MPQPNKKAKRSRQTIMNQGREPNGNFAKRIELYCEECDVTLQSANNDAPSEYEMLDDGDAIIDENETWTEIVDTYDVIDERDDELGFQEEIEDFCEIIDFDDEMIEEKLAEANMKWRSTFQNSNVRGAGSSESTFYSKEQAKRALQKNAQDYSTPITRWFQPKKTAEEVDDDSFIADAIENPAPITKKVDIEPKYTITTALEYLCEHEAKISKNKKINQKMAKEINLWYYLCSNALYQYFALLR